MNYREYCEARGIHHKTSPLGAHDFYTGLEQVARRRATVLADIERTPIRKLSRVYNIMQRVADIFLSGLGLITGAIPFLVIAIAIKIDSAGPVLYRQARVGKGGKVFQMFKFRTMYNDAERMTGPVWAAAQDPRSTRVGALLRRLRLDELPQLFNILMGDMTFVGPRPERPEFVYHFIRYMPAFDRRHEVKPGVTGLAQMKNGYDDSAMSIYKKIRWDMQYLKKRCMTMDLYVLRRTVVLVLKGEIK